MNFLPISEQGEAIRSELPQDLSNTSICPLHLCPNTLPSLFLTVQTLEKANSFNYLLDLIH